MADEPKTAPDGGEGAGTAEAAVPASTEVKARATDQPTKGGPASSASGSAREARGGVTSPAAPAKGGRASPPSIDSQKQGAAGKAVTAAASPHDAGVPSAPPWWQTLRADPPASVRLALGIGLIVVVFLLWFVLTRGSATERVISPVKLPSPGEVFGSFGSLTDRNLIDSIIDTLTRVFLGVGLAAIVGISVGVLAAANRGVGATLAPLVIFLRSVPMGALIPLTLLLFSDGEKQKWMFLFLAIVPFVFSDTVKAIAIVPDRYVETAQTLGASRLQIVSKVLVPLALPDILTSLRFQLGLALGYIMLVEEINAQHGLGKMIMVSQRLGPYTHVYLLLFVIAAIAFTLDLVLRTLQRGVFAWRKDL